MNLKNKKATILIYTIILISLALTLGIIVMGNASILILNQENNLLNTQLNNNINSKVNIFLKTIKSTNSDGGGFIDIYSGSGANIFCRKQEDGSFLVEGEDGRKEGSDGIDDNCDSDNYLGNNSSSKEYPENFEDNDNYAKKNINGLVVPHNSKNIFWNNSIIEKFIQKNSTNSKSALLGTPSTDSSKLFLQVNNEAELKIIEYNKEKYSKFREIKILESYIGTVSGSGFIEKRGKTLSLEKNNTSNNFIFDFENRGYFIFLINKSEKKYINYNLFGIDKDSKSIFINPINDSNNTVIKFLGYDAIIAKRGYISTKIRKKTFRK